VPDEISYPGMTAGDLKALLELRHHDPHALLGPHPFDHRLVVRALRPDADDVVLLPDHDEPRPMHRHARAGLFEAELANRDRPGYRLELHLAGGETRTIHDPYAFAPSFR